MSGSAIIGELEARGLIHDSTDLDALRARLEAGPITLYVGFDPTGPSLHIGHLVPLLLLRRFQQHGHVPIALAGGATGMVGDPGGRSAERNLLDAETLADNVERIRGQLAAFLDFEPGPAQARLVNNYDWTRDVSVLDFLRDVGKHVPVNVMLAKDSIKSRLDAGGLSFTEFSYMLLQAFDFWHLHGAEGCELQAGGADQWGNITAGVDLIRRRSSAGAHGLTVPLLTRADGQKFGKTADGSVWLDPELTTPYALYQYFVNVDDADVEMMLLRLTLLPVDEAKAIAEAHARAPERRDGQKRLAREMVGLIHGESAAREADGASQGFTRGARELSADELAALAGEIPMTTSPALGELVALLVETGLASSNGDARRSIAGGGISVNDERISEPRELAASDLLHGRYVMLRKGKRQRHLVVIGETADDG